MIHNRVECKRLNGERGFTIVEVLIYMVVAVIVIGAVYQVLIGQNRLYSKQRELQDVRGTLRAAGNLLAFEFRQASASNDDLYSITDTSFAVRSLYGAGIVCGIHANGRRFGLHATAGDFTSGVADSALLFAAGASGTGDDNWLTLAVDSVWTSGGSVPFCSYGDTATIASQIVIQLDTAGIGSLSAATVGAPIRVFRRTQYGLYAEDGRWWLGRKVSGAANYQKLIGPMRSPADSGLSIVYYDQAGATTTTATAVRMVDIVLRGESYGQAVTGAGASKVLEDSLRIRVSLRG